VKRLISTVAVFVLIAACVMLRPGNATQAVALSTVSAPMPQAPAACTFPTQVAATPEQTAWQLFVAATCPVGTQYPFIVWETWKEQDEVYQPTGALAVHQRFHVSPLAKKLGKSKAKAGKRQLLPEVADTNCNSGTWTGRTICEEARLNADTVQYVQTNNLITLAGQQQFVQAGKTFQFTPPSMEIKADWIQLATCTNPPQGVHVETLNGKCYALGGIHLISKLIDKWLWATFEPQNTTTNPRRCQVLGCTDAWGATPAKTSGATTQLTAALAGLMKQANLAPEWANYRLDGVQVDFVDPGGQATRLGNSIIEGENAGTPAQMKVSSCITCHDLSTINKQGQGLNPNFIIGPPAKIPPGYVRRDFVWSLGCVVKGFCP
jgi:hypothetical protein